MNSSLSESANKFLVSKNIPTPPPPPSAPDIQSDWGKSLLDEQGVGFPQQYHTIRANRKRVTLPVALGAIGGFERRGGGGDGAGPWLRCRQL
jgi:hypothetical protein